MSVHSRSHPRRGSLLLGGALLVLASSCNAPLGCQGCAPRSIPGGFPAGQRFDNALELRLTRSGWAFFEQHLPALLGQQGQTPLSFTIPPTGCPPPSSQRLCCSGPPCKLSLELTETHLQAVPEATARLALRAKISTSAIKVEQQLLIPWISCDVSFDSARSGAPDLGLQVDFDLVVQDNHKLTISRGETQLEDLEPDDMAVSGGLSCALLDTFKGVLKTQIEQQLVKSLGSMLDGLPLGQEGQVELASVLGTFSPRTQGVLDYLLWAGGYAQAAQEGLSLGVLGGFHASAPNACVPPGEVPTFIDLPRSTALQEEGRPQGGPFDVAFAVHRQALNAAAYAFYRSGGLCVDITTSAEPKLSSSLFALLLPSLSTLTGGANLPMMISTRPRRPPALALGAGTSHQDDSGKLLIDEPLLNVRARDFAAEVYVMLDEQWLRILTVVGDLELPLSLLVDEKGRLQPVLGDLSTALSNVRVEGSELLSEKPSELAQLFSTIMGFAASALGGRLEPIELPYVRGLRLQLDEKSLAVIDGNERLAVFGNLVPARPEAEGETGASPSDGGPAADH